MDKEAIPYHLQQQFFNNCLAAYHSSPGGQTMQNTYAIGDFVVSVHAPSPELASLVNECLPNFEPPDFVAQELRILITGEGSPGFKFPHAPFDRFRFTNRGDILGFEEGYCRATYLNKTGILITTYQQDNTAIVLYQQARLINKEAISQAVIIALSLLLEGSGYFFLPVSSSCKDGFYSLCLSKANQLQEVNSEELSKFLEISWPVWTLIKLGSPPIAFPWPHPEKRETEPFLPGPIQALQPENIYFGDQSSRSIAEVDTLNHLVFKTLSHLPFSSLRHIRDIEDLIAQINLIGESKDARVEYLATPPAFGHPGISNKTEETPCLSVIIPTYNSAQFLPEAVASIHAMKYPNFELIIVDDGSTDQTQNVVNQLLIPAKYHYQENSGASAARNHGLSVASGDFVMFLDADDLINPGCVHSMLKVLQKSPEADGVMGYAQKFFTDANGNRVFTSSPLESFPYYVSAALFRRQVFDTTGYFDESLRFSEDTDWFIRAEEQGCKFLRIGELSLFVRRHPNSLTHQVGMHNLQLLDMLRKKIKRML